MRVALPTEPLPEHLGLAYDSWAPTAAGGNVPDGARPGWLARLGGQPEPPDYRYAFERWKSSLSPGDRWAEVTLLGRLLVGHGIPSAVDVGLTVHHTWGVPVIPGSALKGVTAHYLDAVYGPEDPNLEPWVQPEEESERVPYQGLTWRRNRVLRGPGSVYRHLLGAPDALEDDELRRRGLPAGATVGQVQFLDALYIPGSAPDGRPWAEDTLTVHHRSYYGQAGAQAGEVWPNDYESPTPISFLTVRPGTRLLLALSGPPEWTELAARLLSEALQERGIGAKTSAGYGRGEVGPWQAQSAPSGPGLAAFLAWLQAPHLDAEGAPLVKRSLLEETRQVWMTALRGMPPADQEKAVFALSKKFAAGKLKSALDAFLADLRESSDR